MIDAASRQRTRRIAPTGASLLVVRTLDRVSAPVAVDCVVVSIDLDDTEPWLLRNDKDSTVPLRICVQGDVTFDG